MASHAAAFNVFLQSPWGWPLGYNPRYGESNILFTDSVPIYAFFAKFLFSLSSGKIALTFPLYSVITVILNAIFSWKLSRQLCATSVFRIVLASLLVLNVNWAARTIGAQHTGLASYWVLFWGMDFFARSMNDLRKVYAGEALMLPTVGFLVHPYLGAMVSVFVLCALAMQRRFWLGVETMAVCTLALRFLGVFDGAMQKYPASGWAKAYSLDIGAYLNSMEWGILPAMFHTDPAQSDNAMYLGTGTISLGLCILLLCLFIRLRPNDQWEKRQQKKALSALCVAGLLLMFALALSLRFFGGLVFSLEIPSPFSKLYEVFRVSGRFGLPLVFSLIGVAVSFVDNFARRGSLQLANTIVLVGLLSIALQFSDVMNASLHATHHFPMFQSEVIETKGEIETLLHGKNNWNGRVYKIVPFNSLEQMQLIDYQLQQSGARYFNAVQSARMTMETYGHGMLETGYRNGDLVIWRDVKKIPKTCERQVSIHDFYFCIIRS